MRCIDSRPTPDGYRRRRYRCDDDSILITIEVPATVWKALNKQGRGNDRAAAFNRGLSRAATRRKALAHMRDGWKAIASAHELGVPVRTVQRWRKGEE